jgi:hypothetical protein
LITIEKNPLSWRQAEKCKSVAANLDKHEAVAFGSMMSAPGIWHNGKNFAFFL